MWRRLTSPHDNITIELSRRCYQKATANSGLSTSDNVGQIDPSACLL
jgi:hypothetical protein